MNGEETPSFCRELEITLFTDAAGVAPTLARNSLRVISSAM
jgi:hypothetical protein